MTKSTINKAPESVATSQAPVSEQPDAHGDFPGRCDTEQRETEHQVGKHLLGGPWVCVERHEEMLCYMTEDCKIHFYL